MVMVMPRRARQLFRVTVLWTSAWLMVSAGRYPARSQEEPLEYAVKATYLYKFAPFIEWPSPAAEFPDGSFTVCVVGDTPVDALLDRAVNGQTIAGHPIAIHHYAGVTGNPGCAVMYVAGDDAQAVAAILAAVRGLPVLTVTDHASDPAIRGIINFVISDGHVRFEIDSGAAAANGLTISSKLLSLAARVLGRR
jgi:hypothetical protein